MKRFAMIGAAGFVAPRHMQAIQGTGNVLVSAYDPHVAVGVMDSYFPEADFFVEFERFDRHLDKLQRNGQGIDNLTVCSPNYLHDAHIRYGLRNGIDVICEKPLVLNPWNIDGIEDMERETGKKAYTILQLRLHPAIQALREMVAQAPPDRIHDIDLVHISARGNWYYTSWKGDASKSGGIATNIGVHFFDMLAWIFGDLRSNMVHVHTHDRAAGFLLFEKARVRWFLSINAECLPAEVAAAGKRTWRRILIGDKELEFSEGFADLHTRSYEDILSGGGFRAGETRAAIQMVHDIRHLKPLGLVGDYHPLAKLPLGKHPFDH